MIFKLLFGDNDETWSKRTLKDKVKLGTFLLPVIRSLAKKVDRIDRLDSRTIKRGQLRLSYGPLVPTCSK